MTTLSNNTTKRGLPKWVDLPMLVAAILTVAFYVVVNHQFPPGSMIHRYTTEHVVEYVVVTFFIWGLVDVVFKVCGFPLELMALKQPGLPQRNGKEPVENSKIFTELLSRRPKWFLDSRYGQRLMRALDYLNEKESADGFNDQLRHLASQDEDVTHANFGLIRFICWVAPVLGILGTVIHFGSAFGGMSSDEIGDNITKVMGEIGNAFNTTTIALATAITMMFSMFICERAERGIIRAISRRVDFDLLNRFEVADESLTPFLDAVHSGNRATLQALGGTLDKQLQIWTDAFKNLQAQSEQRLHSHAQLWEQSLVKVHNQFEQSDAQREQKLLRLLSELQEQRTDQKTQTQALLGQIGGMQSTFTKVAESLAGLNRGESDLVKLQQVLAENLRGVRESQQLDQALHGLTGAIHLLTARHDLDGKAKSSRAA
ncbi:MAG TPA: MotA/TolQ/ExbB proton channel family protein [Pirellulales bacterium]|jgi:hypothetical protein